jgi:hypothetical protein
MYLTTVNPCHGVTTYEIPTEDLVKFVKNLIATTAGLTEDHQQTILKWVAAASVGDVLDLSDWDVLLVLADKPPTLTRVKRVTTKVVTYETTESSALSSLDDLPEEEEDDSDEEEDDSDDEDEYEEEDEDDDPPPKPSKKPINKKKR